MATLELPVGVESVEVKVFGNTDLPFDGKMWIKKWTQQERTSRAVKRTLKLLGTIFACSLIGLFVHILLLVILPGLFLTVVGAFPLFLYFKGEEVTFFHVEGTCPFLSGNRKTSTLSRRKGSG